MNIWQISSRWSLVMAVSIGLFGCGDTDESSTPADDNLCEQAQDHIQQCFPDLEISPPHECDPDRAAETLDESCEQLADSEAKADEPCSFWSPAACESAEGQHREMWIHVNKCYNDICDIRRSAERCAWVEVENALGEVVYAGLTGQRSVLHLEDVPLQSGDYRVNLYDRDGELAEMMIEEEFRFGYPDRAEASKPITIEDGDDEMTVDIRVTDEQSDQLRRCARVEGELVSSCGDTLMEPDDTEWSWFVELHLENSYEALDITRPFSRGGANGFAFLDVPVGEHQLAFLQMNVPERDRGYNPDYDELVDAHFTDRVVDRRFEVTEDDIDETVSLGEFELQHEACD